MREPGNVGSVVSGEGAKAAREKGNAETRAHATTPPADQEERVTWFKINQFLSPK
jgi:hypothetical protein